MNKFRFTINALAIAIFTFAFASMAQAQASRTWVSGVGDDANPCSRTAPCKTFAGAISKTAAGGEIDALDPGGFGTLTIGKSITIDGGGGQVASVLGSGVPGFTINAAATDTIELVNLRLNGINQTTSPAGTIAIRVIAARGVHVLNCQIENWTTGISDERSAGGFLEVDNTTIMNTNGNGISANPSSGSTSIHVHIFNSRVQRTTSSGLFLGSNAQATVFNSVFTQNAVAGIFVQQTAGGTTTADVDQCVVSNNVSGFQANTSSSIIRVSNTTAIGNSNLATVVGGGAVSSYGNNQTAGAVFPSAPTGQQ
ncbi:MAG TPA: right-handed parallel beta-helix repeat-containing protein [Pyrinomonadaceae bacterium]|nr:right-handed parallel beta-helix repeat-containing protein [Pyrinomonadaceae bacterium]